MMRLSFRDHGVRVRLAVLRVGDVVRGVLANGRPAQSGDADEYTGQQDCLFNF